MQGVDIAATFAATRPLNQAVRVGVVALLAAVALLLPALILFAFNRHLAKFRPPDGIRSVVEPVLVSKAGVRSRQPASTADDGSSNSVLFELPAEKLRVMALPDRDARVLPGADSSELRTHVPRSLFGSPTAEVRAGEGLRVVSNRAPFIHNRGHSAPVSFGLGDVWYASISDADLVGKSFDEGVPALMLGYMPPRGQGDSIQDVSAKIRNFPHWETVIGQMRSSHWTTVAKQPLQVWLLTRTPRRHRDPVPAAPPRVRPAPVPGPLALMGPVVDRRDQADPRLVQAVHRRPEVDLPDRRHPRLPDHRDLTPRHRPNDLLVLPTAHHVAQEDRHESHQNT